MAGGNAGWISVQLGKPVKWIETRRENMQATIHGRGRVGDIEVAFKNDGTLTGLATTVSPDMVRITNCSRQQSQL
jgi:carbon-monoxide dehydrogenase large subunit